MSKRIKGERAPHPMDTADFHIIYAEDGRSVIWLMHPDLEQELAVILASQFATLPGVQCILNARRKLQ